MSAELAAVPAVYGEPNGAMRIGLIATSFARLLGRPLITPDGDPVRALWGDARAILAHGTEPDPVFFFGNRAALLAFECSLEDFLQMPSRLSAQAPLRDERQALLDRVRQYGYIDDYAGIRISATGRTFAIRDAIVFELTDAAGVRHGQAAVFAP